MVSFLRQLATITDPGAISVDENTTVTTLSATKSDSNATVAWSLSDAEEDDHQLFGIDPSSGALTFRVAPDFENPEDISGTVSDNTYSVTVKATESGGALQASVETTQLISITVNDVDDTAPLITDAASVVENTSNSFYTFTSNETVTWSIAGGTDQAFFEIDSATGELSFKQANIPSMKMLEIVVR